MMIYSDLLQQRYMDSIFIVRQSFLINVSPMFSYFSFIYSHITLLGFVNYVHYLPGRMPGAHCAELSPHLVVS